MAGFFALAYEPGSADRYLLMHFLIDRRQQRRGYGTTALHALVALLDERHPACRSVDLTVHPDNHGARRLYERFGFANTGALLSGEPCYRLSPGKLARRAGASL
jgi:diamine N-acetyltransferase